MLTLRNYAFCLRLTFCKTHTRGEPYIKVSSYRRRTSYPTLSYIFFAKNQQPLPNNINYESLTNYKCSVALPHGTVGWPALCD